MVKNRKWIYKRINIKNRISANKFSLMICQMKKVQRKRRRNRNRRNRNKNRRRSILIRHRNRSKKSKNRDKNKSKIQDKKWNKKEINKMNKIKFLKSLRNLKNLRQQINQRNQKINKILKNLMKNLMKNQLRKKNLPKKKEMNSGSSDINHKKKRNRSIRLKLILNNLSISIYIVKTMSKTQRKYLSYLF